MKRLFPLYILLILAGCTDMSVEDMSVKSNEEFYASFGDADSRTYVDGQIRLRWTADDCITIFKKETYNREFMFTGVTGANAGGFKQKSVDDDFYYGSPVPYNYAIYPHSSTTQLDETDYFFTFNMPAEQTYAKNSFGLGANTMVAVSESGQLMFKNVGSYLRVRLYGKDVSVSSITLTSNGNEAIAGTAKITPVLNGNPTCEMIGTGKSIRLTCPEPIAISNDADNPTDFWIVVPPVTLTNGFSVSVENDKENTQVFEVAKTFTFERNMYTDMKREVTISSEDAIPYLTFTADAEQTLTMSKAVETLEYSVNDGEWKELGTNTVTFGGDNGNLQLRGKSSFGTSKSWVGPKIRFGNNVLVACSGDIRTLIDYENYSTTDTSNARFCTLFSGCYYLKTAPELPITKLASYCYDSMFENCSNLKVAPVLPATTLASNCYNRMFKGCKSLTTAPELPATTLAELCYSYMFFNCESLTTAPELPATKLEYACYNYMFGECVNLTTVSDLSAIILAESCYADMFNGCINLTKAPKLLASELVDGCYVRMFSNCSKINSITMLATDVSASHCLYNWVEGVATTGTFTKIREMTSLPIGGSGIPEGWTVVNYEDGNTFEDDGPPPVEDEGNVI